MFVDVSGKGRMRGEAQAWGRGTAAGWRLPCLLGLRSSVVAEFSLLIVMASGQRGAREPDL